MKLFIKRLLLFSAPFILYLIIAVLIDPYNIIYKNNNPTLIELKSKISYKLNYPLFKLQEYSENPTDIVLLGDSRTNKLNKLTFEKITGMKVTNLSYGGGTLPEIIDTFWYITKTHPIKEVYIGINFNLYNDYNNNNRVPKAIELKESPFSYLFSSYCSKSLFLILKSIITNKEINIEKPHLSKNEFWRYQLEISAPAFYSNYKYPYLYHKSLIDISRYCKEKKIKLVFFIPPTHINLQQRVTDFNLDEEKKLFKVDLTNLGITYDFEYPNEITRNKSNFSDPFHFNDSISDIIIKEILENNIKYARVKNNTYYK